MPALKLKPPPIPEKSIQRQIVDGLRWRGYLVLEVGKTRAEVQCYNCGSRFAPKGWQGNSKGTPDLLVTKTSWPVGCWLGLEVKSATGKLRPEQQQLFEDGRILVVRSFDEAESVLRRFNAICEETT